MVYSTNSAIELWVLSGRRRAAAGGLAAVRGPMPDFGAGRAFSVGCDDMCCVAIAAQR